VDQYVFSNETSDGGILYIINQNGFWQAKKGKGYCKLRSLGGCGSDIGFVIWLPIVGSNV